jgi:hypothetical protein
MARPTRTTTNNSIAKPSVSAESPTKYLHCKHCGQLWSWQRFAEAKWRRINPDGSPHKDSCPGAVVPTELTSPKAD